MAIQFVWIIQDICESFIELQSLVQEWLWVRNQLPPQKIIVIWKDVQRKIY